MCSTDSKLLLARAGALLFLGQLPLLDLQMSSWLGVVKSLTCVSFLLLSKTRAFLSLASLSVVSLVPSALAEERKIFSYQYEK